MKTKAFFALFFLAAVNITLAQNNKGLSYGAFGGMNFQTLTGKDYDGSKLDYSMIVGFNLGASIQVPIAPDFYMETGLTFNTKGAKDTEGGADWKIRVYYLDIPVNLLYKPAFGGGHILIGFGPYIGFGMSGTENVKYGSSDEDYKVKFKNKVKAGDSDEYEYVKRLDAGAGIYVGYELSNGIFARLNTQLGLINTYPKYEGESDSDYSIKNTGFGISLGYNF